MNNKTSKEKKQGLVIVKGDAENLIAKAIDRNVSVETMERLLAMRRELKAEWAKEEFDKAMSAFQSKCPIIKKTKGVKTDSGELAYKYAPLESIVDQVKDLLSKHGFSYGVNQPEAKQGYVKVAFTVKHKSGHSETSSVELPLGNKTRIMSQTQVEAAALTFAKRYAFCNAFGILTGDEDTDSNPPTRTEKPQKAYADEDGLTHEPYVSESQALAQTQISAPYCQIHKKYMRQRTGKNGIWYDHRWLLNGKWQQCNGRPKNDFDEADQEAEKIANDAMQALS